MNPQTRDECPTCMSQRREIRHRLGAEARARCQDPFHGHDEKPVELGTCDHAKYFHDGGTLHPRRGNCMNWKPVEAPAQGEEVVCPTCQLPTYNCVCKPASEAEIERKLAEESGFRIQGSNLVAPNSVTTASREEVKLWAALLKERKERLAAEKALNDVVERHTQEF